MKPISDKKCTHHECVEPRAFAGWQQNDKAIWRKKCNVHYREELHEKRGVANGTEYKAMRAKENGFDSVTEYTNSIHPYRKYRKSYCENIDNRLGFTCTTTILLLAQLEVDHKNGNPSDNDPENLQTLCGCCHTYKTMINEDHKTPGRKELGITY